MKNLSGSVLFLAFTGALVLLFGTYAGYWYVAHQLAWWTFSLLGVGCFVFWIFVKETFKAIRKK